MAHNEKLTNRIRKVLAGLPVVEEKITSRGALFMVDGKVCMSVEGDELVCRIDPALHDEAVQRKFARVMEMKGKPYKGYVMVNEEGLKTKKDFDYWTGLALDFNKKVKSTAKKKSAGR